MEKGWETPYVDTDEPEVGPEDSAPPEDVEWDGVQLADEVIEEGNQLGAAIDVEDDSDNGGVPIVAPAPGESVVEEVPL